MAENKKSFLMYADWISIIHKLPDEKAGKLLKHIFEYINDNNPVANDLIIELAFEPMKLQFKRDLKHWESIRKKRSLAGLASAESRKQNQQMSTSVENVEQTSTNSTVTVNDTVNDTVINKNIPTFEDFKNYALENQENTDIKKLELKYKAWVENGWKDGNDKKIKNWKTKILNTLQYLKSDGTYKQNTSKSNTDDDGGFKIIRH